MPETQNIEYKSSWHDDCLKIAIKREQSNLFELPSESNFYKWICGFANAQGGKIYISRMESIKKQSFISDKFPICFRYFR